MIKFFCDICEKELAEPNSFSSYNDLRSRDFSYGNRVINFRIDIDGKQGGNDVCINCAKRIINNA